MAIGGAMKGHLHNNGNRGGRPYGLMLLLAFGIAIFGVMAIHKLREKRIFNLMVKEKDRQLISLQLLLQKEIANAKAAKWKIEDMKAKMRTLRNQKMELNGHILEMQSTISSLKDEQRAIELALEEKRNEINQLRERSAETSHESDQTKSLYEIIRQKEAEIEVLRHHLELPDKVSSVGGDDPANRTLNATARAGLLSDQDPKVTEGNGESGKMHNKSTAELQINTPIDADLSTNESANFKSEDNMLLGEDGRANAQVLTGSSHMAGEEHKKLEIPVRGAFGRVSIAENLREGGGMSTRGSPNREAHSIRQKKDNGYDSDVINKNVEWQNSGDEEHETHAARNNDAETTGNDQPGSADDDIGSKKLEMPRNLHGGGYTFRGKHGQLSKLKGKRRKTAKGRESNGNLKTYKLASTGDTKIAKSTPDSDDKQESLDRDQHSIDLQGNGSALPNDNGKALKLKIREQVGSEQGKGNTDMHDKRTDDAKKNSEDSPPGTTFLIPQISEDAENITLKAENTDLHQLTEKELYATNTSNPFSSVILDEKNNGTSKEITLQKLDEAKQQTEDLVSIQGDEKQADVRPTNSRQTEVDHKKKEPRDPDNEDPQESETEADLSRESESNPEEMGERYQEQSNEPKF